jgi:hypothetical protein
MDRPCTKVMAFHRDRISLWETIQCVGGSNKSMQQECVVLREVVVNVSEYLSSQKGDRVGARRFGNLAINHFAGPNPRLGPTRARSCDSSNPSTEARAEQKS